MNDGLSSLRKGPIGIFDSGIGGLTVFKEVRRLLPSEDICYLGDTARVPYGTKSADVVRRYAEINVRFLLDHGAKAIVVACNTASATSIEHLLAVFPHTPIIGVIEPVARYLSHFSGKKRIGVIGTATTIGSGVYQRVLSSYGEIVAKACPLFVPLVEEGILEHPLTFQIIDYYLADMRAIGVDTLVLGCTHYPLLRKALETYFSEGVRIIDSAVPTAQALQALLASKDLLTTSQEKGKECFFVTDSVDFFRKSGERFLGRQIGAIEHI